MERAESKEKLKKANKCVKCGCLVKINTVPTTNDITEHYNQCFYYFETPKICSRCKQGYHLEEACIISIAETISNKAKYIQITETETENETREEDEVRKKYFKSIINHSNSKTQKTKETEANPTLVSRDTQTDTIQTSNSSQTEPEKESIKTQTTESYKGSLKVILPPSILDGIYLA